MGLRVTVRIETEIATKVRLGSLVVFGVKVQGKSRVWSQVRV